MKYNNKGKITRNYFKKIKIILWVTNIERRKKCVLFDIKSIELAKAIKPVWTKYTHGKNDGTIRQSLVEVEEESFLENILTEFSEGQKKFLVEVVTKRYLICLGL